MLLQMTEKVERLKVLVRRLKRSVVVQDIRVRMLMNVPAEAGQKVLVRHAEEVEQFQ